MTDLPNQLRQTPTQFVTNEDLDAWAEHIENLECMQSTLNNALTITSQANVKLSKSVVELTKQRDELLAAMELISSGEADNGCILSGGECQSIAYATIARVRSSDREPDSKGGAA